MKLSFTGVVISIPPRVCMMRAQRKSRRRYDGFKVVIVVRRDTPATQDPRDY